MSVKASSAKTALNAKNLAGLGAERLAELLMELATGDASIKRRLRMELAAASGSANVAREVTKRLSVIAKARSFVEWSKIKELSADLELQQRTIAEQVAKIDATEALELMWRFLALANSVLNCCDDSGGVMGDIFRGAVEDLARLARVVKPAPDMLADKVYAALLENRFGQYDRLIGALAEPLGREGLERLKGNFAQLSKEPVKKPAAAERKAVGWGSHSGPIYEDEIEERQRQSAIRHALKSIADAQGDVDSFIAQYDAKSKTMPAIATEIAERLLRAGRLDEAWSAINAVDASGPRWLPYEGRQRASQSLSARPVRGGSSLPLGLFRAFAQRRSSARLSQAVARFRRHRSRAARARLRDGRQGPSARSSFSDRLARARQSRHARAEACGSLGRQFL